MARALSRAQQSAFVGSVRHPSRAELVTLVTGVYGPGIPKYFGSPYEGTRYNTAELALHELSHAVQIPAVPIVPGQMSASLDEMSAFLGDLPAADADLNEARAIAITFHTAISIGLPLYRAPLIAAGARNTKLYCMEQVKFDRLVASEEDGRVVRLGTQQIVDLLECVWHASLSSAV
jgi:hypothetical protein